MQSHRLHTSASNHIWKQVSRFWKHRSGSAMALGGGIVLTVFGAWSIWLPADQIARGVVIDGIDFSRQTAAQAQTQLEKSPLPPDRPIQISFEDKTWQKSTTQLQEKRNIPATVQAAMEIGRRGSWMNQLQERWQSLWDTKSIATQWQFSEEAVRDWSVQIESEVRQTGKHPNVQLTSQITVDPGERGLALQTELLKEELQSLAGTKPSQGAMLQLSAPVEVTIVPLSPDGVTAAQQRAEKLRNTRLRLQASDIDQTLEIPAKDFFAWLTWPNGFNEATLAAELSERTAMWNREPVSAEFELSPDNKKLVKFAPHRDGQTVQFDQLVQDTKLALNQAEAGPADAPQPTIIQAQLNTTAPPKRLADTNTLGINERIAVGTSAYAGSIPNRVFNVQHTAQLVHGTIIPPGEEFSFNQEVGDISSATGFKAAYVIKDGRTQLGDGGGVCQVSTTLFRAVLNGGLPVTRWKAHSYRVGYYEQGSEPGFDATVYAPSVDFRFRNDTGHSIAVAAYPDSEARTLRVELWGTSDGRTAEVSDYKIWNQRSAPAPLFIDDPNLPAGRRQQIDWSAPGASASFHYVAKDKNGKTIQDREFVSVFRPWQAVYLVGTGGQ